MSVLPGNGSNSLLDWLDDVPPNVQAELKNRFDELTRIEQEQVQMGTVVPQLYGSLSRFVANPSTVSVETYKRMLDTDETLGSGIDFLNLCLAARFGDYKHPIKDVQNFVRRAIGQMEGSWHENLDEMFSAEWTGFSVTEQQWQFKSDFDGIPAFVPKKLVTYPPLTIVFAVNRHGEVMPDGIYQYQRFHNSFFNSFTGLRGGEFDGFRPDLFASLGDYPYPIRVAADLTYLTVKIPKDKCIHLRSASTGKFSNPYGRSIFRRAYKNWVMKDAFLKMWLVAADRKGTPLVIGYAAPNDTVLSQNQKNGHSQGGPEPKRADQAMAHAFKQVHNSSFLVLPGRKGETYEVDKVDVQGDMNIFKDGNEYFNKALMRAMLIPPLVMGAGDGVGSYSLGQEHHKIFNRVVDGKLKPYKQGILDQFIRKIIAYNFPKDVWEKHGYGEFVLEEYDPEVMEKLAGIFGGLTENGYMTPEDQKDMDFVREKIGAPQKAAVQAVPMDPLNPGGIDDGVEVHNPFASEPTAAEPPADKTPQREPASAASEAVSALPKKPPAAPEQPSKGDEPSEEEALNGAQVSSLIEVIEKAATGEISRESAIEIIVSAYKLTPQKAIKLLGPKDFKRTMSAPNGIDPGDAGQGEGPKDNPQQEEGEDPLPPAFHV